MALLTGGQVGTAVLRALGTTSLAPVLQRGFCTHTVFGGNAAEAKRQAEVRKMLYRSKQRGFLELDLLVGLWAEREVPKMSMDMLQHYSAILDQENPDLFNWLTGREAAPEHMKSNPSYAALSEHVAKQLGSNLHPQAQAAQGKEWVRGWDDAWRNKPAPPPPAPTPASPQ